MNIKNDKDILNGLKQVKSILKLVNYINSNL